MLIVLVALMLVVDALLFVDCMREIRHKETWLQRYTSNEFRPLAGGRNFVVKPK